jgi:hypothetical protein
MEKIHGMKKTSKIYIRYRAISICITYCKRRAFIDFVFFSHFDFEKDLLKILLSLYHIVIHIYIIIHQSFNLARFFNFTNSQYINFVYIFRAFHIRLHIEHPPSEIKCLRTEIKCKCNSIITFTSLFKLV